MTSPSLNDVPPRKPLRLWPGVVAVVVQWIVWVVVPIVTPQYSVYSILGGIGVGLIVLAWWLFFSRAPWSERFGAIVVMVLAVLAIRPFLHPSIRGGFMGMMIVVYSIPALSLALVVGAVASRRFSTGRRRASMIGAILLACAAFLLLRTDGITGEADSDLEWRWTKTPEERLLAQGRDEPAAPPPSPAGAEADKPVEPPAGKPVAATPGKPVVAEPDTAVEKAADAPALAADPTGVTATAAWPGFRGPSRDSVIRGVRIETDWSGRPPVELWRRPIGPGWSSFAVDGDLVYTQEQRGEEEVVSCYRLGTGEPVWRHRDRARFYESNGGAGPRATPTVHNGRIYALGATGIVNALDARTGAVAWSRNAASDTGAPPPGWGYAGSPLVVGDAVIVAASGRLVAYDLTSGTPRWSQKTGGSGYSSPHLATIDGIAQVLLLAGNGATSVAPADGTRLWQYVWDAGVAIVQPGVAGNGDVLIALGDAMGGTGVRRLAVSRGSGAWSVEERWTTRGLKPYFNDFVVHEGHVFGFDNSIFASVKLQDGERAWKGGRYGHGQVLLLPDQDLLLLLSEDGELALVSATGDKHTELARFKALEGKTWNHPVLVRDILLVRNGEEMAAFRLTLENR